MSIREKATLIIDAPLKHVWDKITDPEFHVENFPIFKSFKFEPCANAVGGYMTVYEIRSLVKFKLNHLVSDAVPEKFRKSSSEAIHYIANTVETFEAVGSDRTRMTLEAEVKFKGAFRLLTPLYAISRTSTSSVRFRKLQTALSASMASQPLEYQVYWGIIPGNLLYMAYLGFVTAFFFYLFNKRW